MTTLATLASNLKALLSSSKREQDNQDEIGDSDPGREVNSQHGSGSIDIPISAITNNSTPKIRRVESLEFPYDEQFLASLNDEDFNDEHLKI